jgi:hypothetical protein
MATLNRPTSQQILLRFVPTIMLLIASFYYIRVASHSDWEADCKRFVAASDWSSLLSLSANLQEVGKADPQTLFFGLMAAERSQDREMAKEFASGLLKSRFINLKLEQQAAELIHPKELPARIQLHRSSILCGILLLIVLLHLFSILFRRRSVFATGILSVLGLIFLFL